MSVGNPNPITSNCFPFPDPKWQEEHAPIVSIESQLFASTFSPRPLLINLKTIKNFLKFTKVASTSIGHPLKQFIFRTPFLKGADIFVNVPYAAHNTYTLAKNWKNTSHTQRVLQGGSILRTHIATGNAVAILISNSSHLNPAVTIIAAKVSAVLAPLSLGMASVLLFIKGIMVARKADKNREKAQLIENKNQAFGQLNGLMRREGQRFFNESRFGAFTSIQLFLLSAGLALTAVSTLLTAGAMLAILTTPLGWVAMGLFLSSTAIAIGVYAYRRHQAKFQLSNEQKNFIPTVLQLPSVLAVKKDLIAKLNNLNNYKSNLLDKERPGSFHKSNLHLLIHFSVLAQPFSLEEKLAKLSSLGINFSKEQLKGIDTLANQKNEAALNFFIDKQVEMQLEQDWKHPKKVNKWISKTIKLIEFQKEKLVFNAMQEAIKSELSSVIKQEELIPVFQNILEIEHLPTDEDLTQYAEKILSSSIWPGTPKLVRQIVQELQSNHKV